MEGSTADLATQWWQWTLSIPASVSPLLDATGARCMVGQHGDTWFLAGLLNGGAASRSCSIPDDVALFFPVANSVNFDTPDICGQVGSLSVAELRKFSANFVNSISKITVTLDGVPLRKVRRVQTDVFPVTVPDDSIFASPTCVIPSRVYARSVDDGYYARIDDLRVGEHMLQFTAADSSGSFSLNVTYRLTVVARNHR